MKASRSLPKGYELYEKIDLAKDRKLFRTLMIISVLLAVAAIAAAVPFHPLNVKIQGNLWEKLLPWLAMVIGIVAYIFLHEGVHGFCIKLFTGENANFGFKPESGMAFASSDWFFPKKQYVTVALAPVVIWGIVLALLSWDVPDRYFWFLYAVQVMNISGAAGDFYVCWRVLGMPKDVLTLDMGTCMEFFAPVKER